VLVDDAVKLLGGDVSVFFRGRLGLACQGTLQVGEIDFLASCQGRQPGIDKALPHRLGHAAHGRDYVLHRVDRFGHSLSLT
jgi:hypothetical protein